MSPTQDHQQSRLEEQAYQRAVSELSATAGGLAHELRNPLSTLMINLELLAEDLNDANASPDDVRRRALVKVNSLHHEAERLKSLLDDFLNLTGPHKLDHADVDLQQLLEDLRSFYAPAAESHSVSVVVETAEPVICAVDANLLRQALLNIIQNAEQAMPDGGTITLRAALEGESAVLSVTDTGVGMTDEDRKRVLQPFFSTKEGGTGLGLSVTRRIIHEHGGSVDIESTLGRGTTFRIYLPR